MIGRAHLGVGGRRPGRLGRPRRGRRAAGGAAAAATILLLAGCGGGSPGHATAASTAASTAAAPRASLGPPPSDPPYYSAGPNRPGWVEVAGVSPVGTVGTLPGGLTVKITAVRMLRPLTPAELDGAPGADTEADVDITFANVGTTPYRWPAGIQDAAVVPYTGDDLRMGHLIGNFDDPRTVLAFGEQIAPGTSESGTYRTTLNLGEARQRLDLRFSANVGVSSSPPWVFVGGAAWVR